MATRDDLIAAMLGDPADKLVPPERRPGQLPDWWNKGVQSVAKALADTVALPGRAMDRGITTEEAVPWAADMALNTAGVSMPFAQKGAAGIFGGRLAQTADTAALAKAEEMAKAGANRDDIWNQTGWFQGKDKQWRFEIPDEAAAFRPEKTGTPTETFAEHTFAHDPLYEAYPQTRSTIVSQYRPDDPFGGSSGVRGAYSEQQRTIGLNPSLAGPERRSTMLHELQHAVQRREGFQPGGSMSTPEVLKDAEATRRARYQAAEIIQDGLKKQRDAFVEKQIAAGQPRGDYTRIAMQFWNENPELYRRWRAAGDELVYPERDKKYLQWDAYRRLVGEVEARNVQNRADIPPAQRRATPPWLTQDVPDKEQIIRLLMGQQ